MSTKLTSKRFAENGADEQQEGVKKKELPVLNRKMMTIWIEGDSPLISNRKTERAMDAIIGKQMGVATAGKEPRDPKRDYEESLYKHPAGGYGFPASGLKKCAVSAITSLKGTGITKVQTRQGFFIEGDFVKIDGTPRMRSDMVRQKGRGGGGANVRFRAEFPKWQMKFEVSYNANVFSADEILNFFNIAGFAVGIGDWRPEKDGNFGRFHVTKVGME